jgi:hypothetical protein
MISPLLLAAEAPAFKPSVSLEDMFHAAVQDKADLSPEKHMPVLIEEQRRVPLKRARDGAILESFTIYPGRKGVQVIPKRHLMRPSPTFGPVKLTFRMFTVQAVPLSQIPDLTLIAPGLPERKGYPKSDSAPRKIYPTPLSADDAEEVKKLGSDVVIRLGKKVLVVDEPEEEERLVYSKTRKPIVREQRKRFKTEKYADAQFDLGDSGAFSRKELSEADAPWRKKEKKKPTWVRKDPTSPNSGLA